MDYWERRIAFWAEGKLKGKQFRFERWKAAEEEKQRRRKADQARKRFQQLVRMMKQLEDLTRLGGVQRQHGLGCIRELEGWAQTKMQRRARGLKQSLF